LEFDFVKKQVSRLTIITLLSISFLGILDIKNENAAQPLSPENNSAFENINNNELGGPLFLETYKSISSGIVHLNGINFIRSSFVGNGTIKNISVTAVGSALAWPKSKGITSLNGSVFLTSKSGKASYSFDAIGYSESGISRSSGAAFFDDNVTGNLGFLANIVGIFRTEAIGVLNGTFAMWEWK
jgi:hypothetical protein